MVLLLSMMDEILMTRAVVVFLILVVAAQASPRLEPRRPELPPDAAAYANKVDYLLEAYFREKGMKREPPVGDEAFLRRAHYDLWGLPPSPGDRAAYLAARGAEKRARMVNRLLDDRVRFAEHWISFWNDLLHNDEGVTYIGDRKSITPWLRTALERNTAYDRMVKALLNPAGKDDPEGFLMGVNWRGDISASQRPVIQAAQNSAQVFLGINLKCNACHDSFISKWKLKDAYGLASFFAEEPLEIVRCDAATGEMSHPTFLYPELGSVDGNAPLAERRAAAASLFTVRENGRFARTFVNRVWRKLFGRGLVEPVDDLDAKSWNDDLLDWLAEEFVDQGYNINWLLREIMTSQAYQMPLVASTEREERPYVFRGPLPRRLTAEQFADSVSAITGEWRVLGSSRPEAGEYAREWRFKASMLARSLGRPIRDLAVTERNNDPTTLQTLELVNGATLAGLLRRGSMRMAGTLPPSPENLFDSGVLNSGFADVDIDISGVRELRLLTVDHDSYDPTLVVAGWADTELEGPGGVTSLPAEDALTLRGDTVRSAIRSAVPSELVFSIAGKDYTRFRARVGVDVGSLRSVINPRVRFYVFGEPPDLDRLGRVRGDTPVARGGLLKAPDEAITFLFLCALSREPNEAERAAARGYFNDARVTAEGLEDLLWSIFLMPEFQYI
jgi:hypothetical protein